MRGIEWEVRMSVWRKGARVKAPLHLTSSHAHIPDLDHGPYLLDQSPRFHPQSLQVCPWGVLTHSAVVHENVFRIVKAMYLMLTRVTLYTTTRMENNLYSRDSIAMQWMLYQ